MTWPEIVSLTADLGTLIGIGIVALFAKSFLSPYLNEKGKNFATREDIKEITEKIKSVESKFEQDNERVRHTLLRVNQISFFQFEKEYALYLTIWNAVVDVKRKALELRPIIEINPPPNETKGERAKRVFVPFGESFNAFLDICELNRPFYSPEVWTQLKALMDLARREGNEFRFKLDDNRFQPDWDSVELNQKKIVQQCDTVCEAIRMRLESFKEPPS